MARSVIGKSSEEVAEMFPGYNVVNLVNAASLGSSTRSPTGSAAIGETELLPCKKLASEVWLATWQKAAE